MDPGFDVASLEFVAWLLTWVFWLTPWLHWQGRWLLTVFAVLEKWAIIYNLCEVVGTKVAFVLFKACYFHCHGHQVLTLNLAVLGFTTQQPLGDKAELSHPSWLYILGNPPRSPPRSPAQGSWTSMVLRCRQRKGFLCFRMVFFSTSANATKCLRLRYSSVG